MAHGFLIQSGNMEWNVLHHAFLVQAAPGSAGQEAGSPAPALALLPQHHLQVQGEAARSLEAALPSS